ncbi:polymorphic toxin-type HINT domain-containing protein [Streptomyces sp. DG2A-72]|uniref:polymorphic toxin-type HINT domain-containing protein n=1 Tax=Streptomyces sp. DG2A-72 TaxID=3051386 RepID=UPI00265BF6AD|nr:polymorphic toxin-type HINT domain-containing protein [Streptomyces sp. DG2A-72]MDO0932943.1 polymorphic toxin-type HINT domain-containing protein [Streptomyces sp. DG2A-72]
MRPMPPFRRTTPTKARTRRRGRIAVTVAFALLPGLLSPLAAVAQEPQPLGSPDGPEQVSTETVPLKPKKTATSRLIARQEAAGKKAADRALRDQAAKAKWPTPGTTTLTAPATGTTSARAGSLPLSLTAPTVKSGRAKKAAQSVKVTVLSQKQTRALGIKGVALTVTAPRSGGTADLSIDYSAFAGAYGGDWAGRLQVLRLPGCALTRPGQASCRDATPLTYTNDRSGERLRTHLAFSSAAADGQTMVLALAAGTKSGGGDYKATPLSASSTWQAGGSSGTFTWNYPLKTPPAAAGPAPNLAISYDSGSVDGRTANTNNQGSQIGEGFDLTSSYIERKYGSCDDDGQDDKYDLCWKYDNASLVLNGKATELVKDDTTGKWRLKDDDASTVTLSTGADNGDNTGEHWTVTTGDGTRYVFGLNKLPGADTERTNSTWTAAVFGDDAGEPGYSLGTSFASRSVVQAWRWNLDYVEDTHGNAMSYWYTKESNYYPKNGASTAASHYTRGGYLSKILYGQRAGALFTGAPAASHKVTFTYSERCTRTDGGCDSLTSSTSPHWPNVPFDAICKDGDKCTGNVGPTFFTRKRLTGITTYAWNAARTPSADFEAVDSWKLTQVYKDPGEVGDSSDQSLWLQSIEHTGEHGTPLSTKPITFTSEFLTNRVDGESDDILPLAKPRLTGIVTETGAKTAVTYAEAGCVAGQARPRPDQNKSTCYPVFWRPNGGDVDPILDWFQKYPVIAVNTTDESGASGTIADTYEYPSNSGAWHYNDDPMTPEKERTWSIWRGFAKVTHLTGPAAGPRSKTVTVYMRGMNGDRLLKSDGKTLDPDARRSAEIPGIKAAAITDADQYAGFTRETVTYNGADEVTGTINDPWSRRTATQHKSYADTEAYYVRTGASHTRTRITSGSTPVDRTRTTVTTYDEYGMAQTVEDKGDDAVSDDETCTRTWYARNASAGLTSLVSRTRTTADPCATADSALNLPANSASVGDVISDTAVTYDATTAWTSSQSPTRGEPKWTGRASGYDANDQPTWQKVSTTTFDTLGRPLVVKDTNDAQTSRTAYTPETTGPLTATTLYDAKDYTTKSVVDFATGATTKVTDPNSKATETTYDSLGRVTQVWLPNRLRLAGATPNFKYEYHLSKDTPSWVSTSTLTPTASGYTTTYTIYDSLLRARETQSASPSGGRIVSLTQYDRRGLVSSTLSDIWDANNAPSGDNPATVEGAEAPLQVDTAYDGAARPVTSETKVKGVKRWTTTTKYQGDRVIQTAPAGGQATATLTNALGQTTETREYAEPNGTGSYNHTRYTYTPAGQQKTLTAHDNSVWSYAYDLFGRKTSATDPDSGTTSTHYNNLDQVEWTLDAENNKLIYEYDVLGRKTDQWQTDKTAANKLAHWDYDEVAKGQQDTSTRYVDGQPYVKRITKFDGLYNATASELTLPATEPLVADKHVPPTLKFDASYNAANLPSGVGVPAVAGLPSEGITPAYDNFGNPKTLHGKNGYLLGAAYSELGDLTKLTLGMDSTSSARKAYLNYRYEQGTRRLTRSYITDDTHSYMPQDLTFTQDDAGNVTSIKDASTLGGTGQADNQCFSYDGYRRMTEAWTPKTADCAATGRTTANLGGAAPYWTSYAYTASGQRDTETQNLTTGKQTTDYAYGTPNGQPHPLDHTTGAKSATYTYDKTGNTTKRPGPTGTQTLAWNSEGKLSGLTEGTKKTGYIYDADGNLLIRRATGDGDTVLYLGDTEVRLTVKGSTKTLTGTRYYSAGGQTIAVRTATAGTSTTKLSFLAADPHGTASVALDATTWAITKRYTTPFGAPRGTTLFGPWPDDKGFLGKPQDTTTGLTHIGAREYDPKTGQFISVDPLLTPDRHQTLNGYSYAGNNPATFSDPTGLWLDDGTGHNEPRPGGGGGGQSSTPGIPPGGTGPGGCYYTCDYGGGGGNSGGTANGNIAGTNRSWCCGVNLAPPLQFGPEDQEEVRAYVALLRETPVISPVVQEVGLALCGWIPIAGAACDLHDVKRSASSGDTLGVTLGVVGFLPFGDLAKIPNQVDNAADALKGTKRAVTNCKCFLAGTDVLMADGTTEDIEDIGVGDEVQTTDPETGETGPRKVTRRIVTEDDKHFNTLSIATQDGVEELTATHEHPFWSPSEDDWIEAGDLAAGMTLLTDDGDYVTVTGNRAYTHRATTYNLTVDDLHTYYVLAGKTPVLVHNSNCSGIGREFIGGQEQFHIIHGDRTGGGHKWPGQPGKTVFPRGWDTDKILDGIVDVATSPNSVRTQQTGRAGALYTRNGDPSRWKVEGVVDGVNIRVIYEPATDRIVTGFPYHP